MKNKKVLIIDDEQDFGVLMRSFFQLQEDRRFCRQHHCRRHEATGGWKSPTIYTLTTTYRTDWVGERPITYF